MIPDHLKADIQSSYSKFLKTTGFDPRPAQKRMIAAIARQLLHAQPMQQILAVEAGTGTGKTLAYLLAAIPIAREKGKTLVISTGTIALQEQLVNKDIPDAISKAGLSFGYRLVKGRGRYLCHLKLKTMLGTDPEAEQLTMYLEGSAQAFTADRLKLYQSMEHALAESEWDGDRDNWEDSIPEEDWRPLTSDRYQCLGRSCAHVSQCAFFSARNQLEDSQVLVANHDLVLSDLALGGGVILPAIADCIFIFDEAHHLGDKARRHFASRFRLGSALSNLEQQRELLPRLKQELGHIAGIGHAVDEAEALCVQLAEQLAPLKALLLPLVERGAAEGASNRWKSNSDRLAAETRFKKGLVPEELKIGAAGLTKAYSSLHGRLELLADKLNPGVEEEANKDPGKDAWYPVVGQWLSRIEGAESLWRNFGSALVDTAESATRQAPKAVEQGGDYARWLRHYETSDDYELFASPILAGDMLYDQLWSKVAGAVLTSATLTALGSFERLKMRSGLGADTACLQLPSPFDYANKSELEVPKYAVDPKDTWGHDAYLIEELPNILNPDKGNLVLFASGRQMDEVFDHLDADWQKKILVQGSRSKQHLIGLHKSRIDEGRGNTIFGLASFAEGIDLPGKYCEHVVIAKIPFGVPTAPEEEAFAEWVEAHGGNSFRDISLADASMRLVQAVGRLLRSESDEGRVTITDVRLLTRSYGRQLLAALPPMKRVN